MQRRHSITPWDAGKGWGVLGWQICSAGLQLEQSTAVLSRGIAECLLASFPPPPLPLLSLLSAISLPQLLWDFEQSSGCSGLQQVMQLDVGPVGVLTVLLFCISAPAQPPAAPHPQ